jgi:UDP-GlcNAc:undecaprenyl-phosphate/decaprenyl-phosphate GlcNAc-1-phosphate transferase
VRRVNYRGRPVLFPLGVLLISAAGFALAVWPSPWLVFLLGVGLVGLVDDFAASSPRGLREHGRALARGELSTGAIKAVGTLALAAYAASGDLADTAVLALAAHVGNLLDTRPGRTGRGAAFAAALACAAAWRLGPLEPIAPLILPVALGASLTLRERAMLGDSGASLVGGMAGICLIATWSEAASYVALAGLLAISLYGEFRSISATVDRVPLLERLDSLGRVN